MKETTSKSTSVQPSEDFEKSPRACVGDISCKTFLGRREKTGNLSFSKLHVSFLVYYKFQIVKSIVGDILYFKVFFLLSAKISFNLA